MINLGTAVKLASDFGIDYDHKGRASPRPVKKKISEELKLKQAYTEYLLAMALFFASYRWGDGEGIFNYSREAREILKACIYKGENGRPGAPMWNLENKEILFVPGAGFTDPSVPGLALTGDIMRRRFA